MGAGSYFRKAISPEYWCLVDSNREVPDVPVFLAKTRAFIVQATSPRDDRMQWAKKYEPLTIMYFMKNWSLAELIMG